MSTAELEYRAEKFTEVNWIQNSSQNSYHCDVCLIQEEDKTFSAIVLNLPGAGSCGVSRADAIDNVREAILGVIESHREAGEEIPWTDSVSTAAPEGTIERKWILVNA
ncbi:MAG: type II toxin-antitoxin system HicB family antitoxin [Planctomycetota bacterium]|nr:type II toxin-antitoxin system HicB family antitoxin [Planctomycetota bacterium]